MPSSNSCLYLYNVWLVKVWKREKIIPGADRGTVRLSDHVTPSVGQDLVQGAPHLLVESGPVVAVTECLDEEVEVQTVGDAAGLSDLRHHNVLQV